MANVNVVDNSRAGCGLCVLEKYLRPYKAAQLDKPSYQYKLDRALRTPMNSIMNIGQDDLVGRSRELAF